MPGDGKAPVQLILHALNYLKIRIPEIYNLSSDGGSGSRIRAAPCVGYIQSDVYEDFSDAAIHPGGAVFPKSCGLCCELNEKQSKK